MTTTLIGVLLLGAYGTAYLVLAPLRAPRLVERFARRLQMPEPARRRRDLERRLVTRHRAMGLAGLVAAVLFLAWRLAAPGAAGDEYEVLVPLVLLTGCVAIAQAGRELTPAVRPDPDAPRCARTRAVELRDYVARAIALGPRVMVGLNVALCTLALGLSTSGWFDFGELLLVQMLVVTAVSIVVWLIAEVAVRRVLAAPQPAAGPEDLYWQDALRAETLRSVLDPALLMGMLGYLAVLASLDRAAAVAYTGEPASGLDPVPAILIGGWLVLLTVAVGGVALELNDRAERPYPRFRRRLWTRPTAGSGARQT